MFFHTLCSLKPVWAKIGISPKWCVLLVEKTTVPGNRIYLSVVCENDLSHYLRRCCSSLKWKNYVVFMLQREKKSLLKLLSSNKKKSRPSPPSSPTLEAEQAAAGEVLHGAMGHDTSPPSCSVSCLESESAAAVASASSPSPSSSVPESSHWKSSPLDGCAPIAPPPRQPCSSLVSQHHDARPIICERYTDVNL